MYVISKYPVEVKAVLSDDTVITCAVKLEGYLTDLEPVDSLDYETESEIQDGLEIKEILEITEENIEWITPDIYEDLAYDNFMENYKRIA